MSDLGQIQNLLLFNATTLTNLQTIAQSDVKSRGYYQFHFGMEQAVMMVLFAFCAYLAVVSTFYIVKHGQVNLKCSNTICCLSAALLFIECCLFEIEEYLPEVSGVFCYAYTITNAMIATLNRTLIYSVLWIRQRSLYMNRMQKLKTGTVQIISKGTIFGIVVFSLLQVALLASVPQYAVNNVCTSGSITVGQEIMLPLTFAISSLFQLLLLGLTVYPVIRHQCSGIQARQLNAKLKTLLLRLTICTAVCVIGDFVFMALAANPPNNTNFNFIPTCSAFNTGVHIISMMFSFADYKLRLWPFRKRPARKRPSGFPQPTPTGTSSSSRNLKL